MTKRVLTLLALLLSLTLTAGCGGGDNGDDGGDADQEPTATSDTSPTDEPAGDEACDLLSAAEVSEAVGTEVSEGERSDSPVITGGTQTTCRWASVENPGDVAMVTVYSETSAADSVRQDDSEKVPGLGDDAFTSFPATVWVYVGERSFLAQWYSIMTDEEENLPKSRALAELVVDRL